MNNKTLRQLMVRGELTEYIKGRISGIIEGVTCDPDRKRYAIAKKDDITIFRFNADESQFTKIYNLIGARLSHMLTIIN